ncbi:hypothetical protein [Bifidobacterium gallicum]|nr:hypothetical protein [Bifidobacterium gallicum]KFI58786.1 hypothetical protein BGLCM_1080 [Bifidobacterium gallicum DSM 20093 = LMG 11596]
MGLSSTFEALKNTVGAKVEEMKTNMELNKAAHADEKRHDLQDQAQELREQTAEHLQEAREAVQRKLEKERTAREQKAQAEADRQN